MVTAHFFKAVRSRPVELFPGLGRARVSGSDIPLAARIVAVADVFDALTSARPYKHAWPVADAVGYLREQKDRHFDARLVDLFIQELPAIEAIRLRWAEKEDHQAPA